MANLTDIGFQKTPARPVEITFAAQGGTPNANQTLAIIGHMGAPSGSAPVSGIPSGTAVPYVPIQINNVADPVAGAAEVNGYFGQGSELALGIIAAIQANFAEGNANFPMIVAVPLAIGDAGFGPENGAGIPAALAACDKFEAEFLVSPYDAAVDPSPANNQLTNQLLTQAQAMSGPNRVQNGQFGTIAVGANTSTVSPSNLPKYNTQFFQGVWLRDTSGSYGYSFLQLAAAEAAILGGNLVPFNPVDNSIIGEVPAPKKQSDWITVGAGLESEAALNCGWTPLRVFPTGDVGIVRSVTSRLYQSDGVTQLTAYYDVQDFQVLYYFRKAVAARFNQPDFTNQKASAGEATLARSEVIRLASTFEDQEMFQAVEQLSPQIQVQRNSQDRSRFDVFVPVNVVPGLHIIATNVQATTVGDVFTV